MLMQAIIRKNVEMMVKAALKRNIKKDALELEIDNTVHILNNALKKTKGYGSMKVASVKKC